MRERPTLPVVLAATGLVALAFVLATFATLRHRRRGRGVKWAVPNG